VFSSREALDTYAVSEAHVNVVTNHVKPNVDGECSSIDYFKVFTSVRTGLMTDVFAYDFELDQ
jgi:hypothetical protein